MELILNKQNCWWLFRTNLFFTQLARLIRVIGLLAATLLLTPNASANVLDTIEVARVENSALITIRFATEIQYLRHGPENQGRFLRIFFRVTKPGFVETDVMQETLRSPTASLSLIPRFTVAYPELVNGLLVTFAKPTKYSVRPGDDNRSVQIIVPLAADLKAKDAKTAVPPATPPAGAAKAPAAGAPELPTAEVTPAPVAEVVAAPELAAEPARKGPLLSPEKVESLAQNFFVEARDAFDRADYPKAINRLNRVLGLPSNAQTMAAQALLGESREKNGEIAKARAEYELYLKLFPNSADAGRIKERLAGLPSVDVIKRQATKPVRDDKPAEWVVTGSLSSYLFTGRTQTDSGPKVKDQESLISNISLNARLRDSVTDTRFVFRDTDSRNNLNSRSDYNRVYNAYAERTDREVGYFVRAGRQNPSGAGVLERFDGITGGYNLGSDWRISGVYGKAVEFNSPFSKDFYGASIDFLPQISRPGASLYVIEQNLDGFLNRRAVGSEFRYFDGQFTGYGNLDYDLLYKGLNIAALQGNFLTQSGTNYFVSYDYRKSPSLSLSNALASSGFTTVDDLVNRVGISQARTLVTDNTAVAKAFAAGVTVPVTERWQIGADYRMSSISGTNVQLPLNQICKSLESTGDPSNPRCIGGPRGDTLVSELCEPNSFDIANNTCRASSSTAGTTHIYSAQAIGTNLFVPNAVGVVNTSWITGPDYTGQSLGLNYILPFGETWRLESNLRYYTQKSDNGQNSTQFSPSLKLVRQWNSLYLEGEVGYNDSKNSGTTQSETKREYLYMGIRWDYR